MGHSVEVLLDGDPMPSVQAFNSLSTIQADLRPYVDFDAGTMVMNSDQALYLFELGTTNMNVLEADYQDLVVLVTFTSP